MELQENQAWLDDWLADLKANKDYLSQLDQKIGDGDHGNNMARGAKAVEDKLAEKPAENTSDLFMQVAQLLMSKIGGASGPLYGSAFLAMATAAKNSDDLTAIFAAGLDKIKQRGKAETGEKTMVDMWQAAIDALEADDTSVDRLDQARDEIIAMKASKGRASYYGDRSVGEMDPGAESSYYLFKNVFKQV